jgi:hypothetical protein
MRTVTIYGKDYPFVQTMGAWVFFKALTGKEASAIDGNSPTEQIQYFYCVVKAACLREGIEFDLDFDRFACGVDLGTIAEWNNALVAEAEAVTKKKTAPRR